MLSRRSAGRRRPHATGLRDRAAHSFTVGTAICRNVTGLEPSGRSAGSATRSRYRSASCCRSLRSSASSAGGEVEEHVAERRRLLPLDGLGAAGDDPAGEALEMLLGDEELELRRGGGELGRRRHVRPAREQRRRTPGSLPPLPAGCLLDEPVLRELAEVVRAAAGALPRQQGGSLRRGQRPFAAEQAEQLQATGMGERTQCARVPQLDRPFHLHAKISLQRFLFIASPVAPGTPPPPLAWSTIGAG